MKRINSILGRCKTLSREMGRSSSDIRLRSRSMRDSGPYYKLFSGPTDQSEAHKTIFVGSSRIRYVISSKFLNHPLLNALIEKSKYELGRDTSMGTDSDVSVKCEVVLFDHLLWMLENADPSSCSDSLEELAELYVCLI
ncbi:SAUR-like auxin-responsive protein family [Striga asiatica]|uniref:SAUR-like auxin-responsive protein family n=1 Tax=Striga asiatica TaxID=4170 RepID=A0A5A7PMK1_STRAF|nr:SAUR-like auxin-responsive protein family [Striga asiatica]